MKCCNSMKLSNAFDIWCDYYICYTHYYSVRILHVMHKSKRWQRRWRRLNVGNKYLSGAKIDNISLHFLSFWSRSWRQPSFNNIHVECYVIMNCLKTFRRFITVVISVMYYNIYFNMIFVKHGRQLLRNVVYLMI